MLDEKEKLILSLLRKNSRTSLREISTRTGIPISTVHDRLKKIEEKGVSRNTSLIDFEKVGLGLRAFVTFTALDRKIIQFLIKNPLTNSIFRINSGYGFLVEVVFRSLRELHDLISELKERGAQEVQEHHVIEEVKREEYRLV